VKLLIAALGIYSRVGGIERYLQRVIQCLAEDPEAGAVEVVILWDPPRDLPADAGGVGLTACHSDKLRFALTFARTVLSLKPEVVLFGHVLLAPLAGLARLLSPKSRRLLLAYGVEVWGQESQRGVPWWERLMIRRWVDRVVSISQFTADRMREHYRLPAGMYSLMPCAVDIGPAPATTRKRRRKGQRLLTVSRLVERYKGWHQVLRALPKVVQKVPEVEYVVVGEGPLRAELEVLAEREGVANHVRFTGRLGTEELEQVYADSDVFVMPSSGEGFGIVFLEAWAHGLPVVAGNRDAAAEFITPTVDGLTVDPSSTEDIAGAILQLLQDSTAARRMGMDGYRQVRQRFSHQQFCGALQRLLQERD
jgi:glycosyltransferase involved in cell wall biosynthesis